MPTSAEDVATDRCYRTPDGEIRLVWLVRDGKVHYFHRPEGKGNWTPPACYKDPPTIEAFAAAVAGCEWPADPPSVLSGADAQW